MSPERRSPDATTPTGGWFFLWLVGLTCLLRFPALISHPFSPDESYYAAGAAELVSGGAYFRDVVDHKPPGIYLIYAFIYRLAGVYNQTAVHAVLLLVVALSAYFVARITQELFGGRAGRWAGTLYAVTSVVGPAQDFQAANTELFMNLPLLAALWLCARAWARRQISRHQAGVMGFLLGLAILIRPHAAVALVPIGVVLYRRRAGWLAGVIVGGAALLPMVGLIGWLVRADAMGDLRASLAYASYYTQSLPFEVKLANATFKTLFFLAIDVGVVIPAALLLARGRRHDQAWQQGAGCLLVSWLAASALAVGLGGRFYPHYFIQVLPPLAIMAARQLTHWQQEAA
jgi:4-amino-4-deoxy-L-arabinose transferase-like glycosyltransferase